MGTKRFGIITGKRFHATDIVVEHSHRHALGCFALQHLRNGVTELSFFNNEVFHENEFFCAFKVGNHPLKHFLAEWKIVLFCVGE